MKRRAEGLAALRHKEVARIVRNDMLGLWHAFHLLLVLIQVEQFMTTAGLKIGPSNVQDCARLNGPARPFNAQQLENGFKVGLKLSWILKLTEELNLGPRRQIVKDKMFRLQKSPERSVLGFFCAVKKTTIVAPSWSARCFKRTLQ